MQNKHQIIIALVPALITTLGIGVFLLFFNYTSVTFEGSGPFQVQVNGSTYQDSNGQIKLDLYANSHTFQIHKENHFDQTITQDLSWRRPLHIPIEFIFKPIITEKSLSSLFKYPRDRVFSDNQSENLLFANFTEKDAQSIPKPFNHIVWARDGSEACLFAPQAPTVSAQLWSRGVTQALPTGTFNCFATSKGLLSAQLLGTSLAVNGTNIYLDLDTDFTLSISDNSKYALLSKMVTMENMLKTDVIVIEIAQQVITSLGVFHLSEPPRFVSEESIAINLNNQIKIFSAPFGSAFELPLTTSLITSAYDDKTNTLYYLRRAEAWGSFWQDGEETTYQLVSNRNGSEHILHTFPAGTSIGKVEIDATGKMLVLLNKDRSRVYQVQLKP